MSKYTRYLFGLRTHTPSFFPRKQRGATAQLRFFLSRYCSAASCPLTHRLGTWLLVQFEALSGSCQRRWMTEQHLRSPKVSRRITRLCQSSTSRSIQPRSRQCLGQRLDGACVFSAVAIISPMTDVRQARKGEKIGNGAFLRAHQWSVHDRNKTWNGADFKIFFGSPDTAKT